MALSIGIVGLPNVGKSTTFNALTKAQHAEAANYPFCTIEPNKAIVPVPDPRLDKLASLLKPQKVTHATIEFVDIAGLVKGASQGEGLGNQFLGHIRETSAIVHVVRCFQDDNVVHVNAQPDPKDDAEVINMELILADLQQLERKIDRLQKQMKSDNKLQSQYDLLLKIKTHFEQGNPARVFPDKELESVRSIFEEMRFITDKQVIYVANVDEGGLLSDNEWVQQLKQIAEAEGAEVVKICARAEEELSGLTEDERIEFLQDMGVNESGLDQVIHKAYALLGLISFLTAGPKEVRAWTLRRGMSAPQAAGVIHTDFERGFIRAEVIPYTTYIAHGSESAAKAAGQMSLEGKEYIVRDGDVIYFRFNV